MKIVILIYLALLLSACVPANTPNELAALASVRQTQESGAIGTQAASIPVTQSHMDKLYAQHATETAIPPALTQRANDNRATDIAIDSLAARATSESLYLAHSLSATVEALSVLESETQKTIAENNAAIARATIGVNTFEIVMYTGAGVLIVGLAVLISVSLWQLQALMVAKRKTTERRMWDAAELEHERRAREFGFIPSSAGLVALAPPIVEARKAEYIANISLSQSWRTAARKLVEQGVIAGRGGAKHPFSETTLGGFVLRPESGAVWLDGYRRLSRFLIDNGIWVSAGPRIAPVWGDGWSWERFEREFDLTPLHHIPNTPPPDVKIPAWSFGQVGV